MPALEKLWHGDPPGDEEHAPRWMPGCHVRFLAGADVRDVRPHRPWVALDTVHGPARPAQAQRHPSRASEELDGVDGRHQPAFLCAAATARAASARRLLFAVRGTSTATGNPLPSQTRARARRPRNQRSTRVLPLTRDASGSGTRGGRAMGRG